MFQVGALRWSGDLNPWCLLSSPYLKTWGPSQAEIFASTPATISAAACRRARRDFERNQSEVQRSTIPSRRPKPLFRLGLSFCFVFLVVVFLASSCAVPLPATSWFATGPRSGQVRVREYPWVHESEQCFCWVWFFAP